MPEAHGARINAALSHRSVAPPRLAGVCLELFPSLDGASVTVIGEAAAHAVVTTSGSQHDDLLERQFTLGEGPYLDAHLGGCPVLASDIAEAEHRARWPGFAAACLTAGVHGVFALPLRIGALRLGVLNLHRRAPGALDTGQLAELLIFAEAATLLILDRIAPDDTRAPQLRLQHRVAVHQATGVIMAQLGIDVDEAFVRLRAYTYTDGRSLDVVAAEVVARWIRFDVEE